MQKTESGKFREAIMDFNKVIELDPNQAKAYQYRGVAKAKYGDFAGAIIDYDKAIEKDSNNTDSYSSRGIAKARLGNLTGAIVDFDVALELNQGRNAISTMEWPEMSEVQRACLDRDNQ